MVTTLSKLVSMTNEVSSNKPAKGHVAKVNTAPKASFVNSKTLKAWKLVLKSQLKLQLEDIVDVTGTSSCKVSRVIKRHGQSRGPIHGSRYHRRPGSMGPVAPNRIQGKTLQDVWVATA